MLLQRTALRAALACALLLVPAYARAWEGTVSFYGAESGRVTANGERFRPAGRTCAHWTLPFGTRVRVTDLATGRSVECRVNDRGPHPRLRRALDLAHGAAAALGILHRGVIRARLAIVRAPGAGRLHLADLP
jgi:rare lipoprotein A